MQNKIEAKPQHVCCTKYVACTKNIYMKDNILLRIIISTNDSDVDSDVASDAYKK